MNWSTLLSADRQDQKKEASDEYTRSSFERDFDRIIFSHPFRKLQDKTQVHPLPEHDFVHTRLTHSLEVSSVGRSLGKLAGQVITDRHPELNSKFSSFDFGAITAAASLAHDMGNPPFGHAGEAALSEYFKLTKAFDVSKAEHEDLINFEGNAQGFRILNKKQFGLRLTYATLGAFTKYPCPSLLTDRDKKRKSQKKFGYFQSEADAFKDVAESLGLIQTTNGAWCRHPLAFLVEAADDICYSIIDLEDGCRMGLVTFNETVDLLAPILGSKLDRAKLSTQFGLNEKLGVLRAMTIGELIDASTEVFLDNEEPILDGSFDKALTDLCKFKDALGVINKVSVEKIYRTHTVVEIEASGHEVLPGLLHEFVTAGIELNNPLASKKYKNLALLFPEEIRAEIAAPGVSQYTIFRSVIDFISGLTDRHALALYRKIKGISF
ncbi:MAG TPA: deoxyguanosinetriphosphate triphosphohydrolase [Cyclobacteriaceae bacterium]|nr:deoxyguanosinetriphosphate triphosphohydrolase [Cyclobacteriaceae bacterium]